MSASDPRRTWRSGYSIISSAREKRLECLSPLMASRISGRMLALAPFQRFILGMSAQMGRRGFMSEIKYVVDVPGYPPSHSPYSHAVVANGFVFVSGQAAVRPGGGALEIVGTTMQEQTRQALRNVETVLKAAGSSLDKLVKVTVLLARPDLFKEMNEAYAEFFPKNKPARAAAQ